MYMYAVIFGGLLGGFTHHCCLALTPYQK